jgi:hypothetical protein
MRWLFMWLGKKKRAYDDLCYALASLKRSMAEVVQAEMELAEAKGRACDAYMGRGDPGDCYELDNEQREDGLVVDHFDMEIEFMPEDPRERQTRHNALHYEGVGRHHGVPAAKLEPGPWVKDGPATGGLQAWTGPNGEPYLQRLMLDEEPTS